MLRNFAIRETKDKQSTYIVRAMYAYIQWIQSVSFVGDTRVRVCTQNALTRSMLRNAAHALCYFNAQKLRDVN